jgi:hypothetical protein
MLNRFMQKPRKVGLIAMSGEMGWFWPKRGEMWLEKGVEQDDPFESGSVADLCIPRNQTARPQSLFLHSYSTQYLWAIYMFPRTVCLFCCSQIGRPIMGLYKSLTDIWMWKLELRPRSFLCGNTLFQFTIHYLCSAMGIFNGQIEAHY